MRRSAPLVSPLVAVALLAIGPLDMHPMVRGVAYAATERLAAEAAAAGTPQAAAVDALRAASRSLAACKDDAPYAVLQCAKAVDSEVLERAFKALTDKKTPKDVAMDQAAFIVYYEEARYKDYRLEPTEPSRRANQNGYRKAALSGLSDLKAEAAYLASDAGASESDEDLRGYLSTTLEALDSFIETLRVQ